MRKLLITATLIGGFVAGRLFCADLLVVARRPREGTDLRFGRPPAHPRELGAHLGARHAGSGNPLSHAWRYYLTRVCRARLDGRTHGSLRAFVPRFLIA